MVCTQDILVALDCFHAREQSWPTGRAVAEELLSPASDVVDPLNGAIAAGLVCQLRSGVENRYALSASGARSAPWT